jgi:hypothetical protein
MAQRDDTPEVPRVAWDEFMRLFKWNQGEHVILIGPAGRGKTTLAGLILPMRRFVVALDFKGDDPSLKRWGWETLDEWPPPGLEQRMQPHERKLPGGRVRQEVDPVRLRLSPPARTRADWAASRPVFEECLDDIFAQGRWCVYTDELLIATGTKFALGDTIEDLVVSGRSRGISMVSSTQAPRWIPKVTYDQATHLFIWPVRDFSGLERVEEITGWGRVLRSTLAQMPKHDVLYVKPPDTLMITQTPKPARPASVAGVPDQETDEPPETRTRVQRRMWGE